MRQCPRFISDTEAIRLASGFRVDVTDLCFARGRIHHMIRRSRSGGSVTPVSYVRPMERKKTNIHSKECVRDTPRLTLMCLSRRLFGML